MDQLIDHNTILVFTLWLLLLLLNADDDHILPTGGDNPENNDNVLPLLAEMDKRAVTDTTALMTTTFLNFRLCASMNVFHDKLEYRVKPRSTTWFSRYLLQQYDSSRWISMFRMTKLAVFALAEIIRPYVEKKNTKYRLDVPVLVRVACTLFKLTHAANFTICNKVFAIDRSVVSKILLEVVYAINSCLRQEISWPMEERMLDAQCKFHDLCSLPAVVGAVDGTHFSISKPIVAPVDYYYFKIGGYSITCQAVVDSEKRFLDVYVGMPGSTNDSWVLRRSTLYHLASHDNLFFPSATTHGFSPYLLGDLGYPLLPWLIIPHRDGPHLSVSERLLNQKLRKGHYVVENAFGILKQSFRELAGKSELQVTFLPDVIVCCTILHDILLRQSHEEVAEFLEVLQEEGYHVDDNSTTTHPTHGAPVNHEEGYRSVAHEKQLRLEMFLSTQRW